MSGITRVSWYQKGKIKTNMDFLDQETVSGSGFIWTICKSAPCPRQITTPTPLHSVFYRPDALPAAQPTASKHWRHNIIIWIGWGEQQVTALYSSPDVGPLTRWLGGQACWAAGSWATGLGCYHGLWCAFRHVFHASSRLSTRGKVWYLSLPCLTLSTRQLLCCYTCNGIYAMFVGLDFKLTAEELQPKTASRSFKSSSCTVSSNDTPTLSHQHKLSYYIRSAIRLYTLISTVFSS